MKIGFIGTGKIGTSLIQGLLQAGTASTDLYVYSGGHQSAEKVATQYQLQLVNDYVDFAGCAAVIVAVGGPTVEQIIVDLGTTYHGIILSTGGGDLVKINAAIPADTAFAKIVPNTPVQIGTGITAVSFISDEKQEVITTVKTMLAKLGDVYVVPEKLLGIYGTVSGCAPAYVDMMIEALSDAAVQNGVKRAESYPMIEKMILGTAKLALATGKLPEELKDEVTTPGGTTIKGVTKLEEQGFRNALIKAINASAN
ncbi:NAD(P)-binding domain-containing protein [Lactobacillus sp. ESL0785]|uniref:pyrroline-5-carboxylate reductase family protein n=1 Tax=Lactobacillus sp. ESL0785 TaxID=2983232 RepID=UPI0023F72027|nr:pyrroline-5-carboxylate reductase dimerization domain-containing protein [Lactobacillus sp. ESL0785]WEV70929.1 NAD(P)-binding domain-containing protein [Lactobacillus sp. ESL0785]